MLGTMPERKKATWHDKVPTLVHAYDCTKSCATWFSLYYLMYGHKSCLSTDLYLGMQTSDKITNTSTKIVQNLMERLSVAYKTAQQVVDKENQCNKCNYDHKVKYTCLQKGDLILLNWTAYKGKHNIQDPGRI